MLTPRFCLRRLRGVLLVSCVAALPFVAAGGSSSQALAQGKYPLNDSHFHLTNYIQEGIDIRKFLSIMGDRVGRVALFGIPLQQQWSFRDDGNNAPVYYLSSDAPLYYYSFTDAYIAMAYKSLSKEDQARFDPMITGFNPTDMYAADHIRRVLETFPGVFSGIGEFSIHKEFVSSKIAGEVASLQDPALDRLLDFAAEVGLVAIIHNYIDTPFSPHQSDVPSTTPGPDQAPSQDNDNLGAHRRGANHPPDESPCRDIGLAPERSRLQQSLFRHFLDGSRQIHRLVP